MEWLRCVSYPVLPFSSKENTKFWLQDGLVSLKTNDARIMISLLTKDLGMTRVEVRSKLGNSHLGHDFMMAQSQQVLRYCMNFRRK